MKKLIVLIPLFIILFWGCGGTTLEGPFRTEGIVLKYDPAVGNDYNYEAKSDGISDFSISGQTSSSHYKQVMDMTIGVKEVNDKTIATRYVFNSIEAGTFQNGQYVPEKEENELVGQFLTIRVKQEDGKLDGWEGLEELDFDEAGLDQAEGMANDFASIIFNWFPTEKVKVGSKWEVANNTRNTLEDGGYVEENRVKSYTLEDFVLYEDRKCAKIAIKVDISVNNESSTEDDDGNEYEIKSTGNGEGNGVLYYDFENGVMVYNKLSWLIDAQADIINVTTGETDDYSQYTESHREYKLK